MSLSCQETARWLESRDGYLILTHKRPDGDTVGCAVALCLALRKLGKTAYVLPNEDATALFAPYWGDTLAPEGFTPDTLVSTDIASEGLFPASAEACKGKVDLAIDHHGSNTGFAKNLCLDPDKAACGEIIYDIVTHWFPVDAAISLPLYVALATDTGCFLYSNTTPNTHRVAAALMETGIDAFGINKRHFRTKSYTRLRLEGHLAATMDLHDGGAIAIAALSLADKAALAVTQEDLEDIAAFVGQLEGVDTAVTIQELKPGECKLSVRTNTLDASAICALHGGGGHPAAAGCTILGTVEEAKAAVLRSIRQVQSHG